MQMKHGTVCALIQYIVIIVKYIGFEFEGKKKHFIFPTMKGSMNACMELVGFSTSNKVKNHCSSGKAAGGNAERLFL